MIDRHTIANVRRKLCAEARHDRVVVTVQNLIQSCSSVWVRREHRPPPIDGVRQTRQRPDLCIDQTILGDVVVTTPTCESYVKNKVNSLVTAERLKVKKYEDLTKRSHSVFYAFGFTAYGGWGKGALDGMNALAELAVERSFTGNVTRPGFMSRSVRVVAVALTRGNGNLVRTALRLAQRRPVGAFSVAGSVASSSMAAAAAAMPVGGGIARGRGSIVV